jgi:hypothetical protein
MELRQQLSADAMSLLEGAAKAEIERLKKLHWSIVPYTIDKKVIEGINADIEKYETAIKELHAVFLDQFEPGREENNKKGKTGLKR